MRNNACILLIGLFLTAGSLSAGGVTSIDLTYVDGATVARIHVDDPIRFVHQTEIPKDGKPHRVIVDILSAVHELDAKVFTDLPKCPVVGIRTSQYSVTPENVVRIVFDMARSPLYQIDTDNSTVRVIFTDKSTRSFAKWSTTSSAAESASKRTKSVAVASTAKVPETMNKAMDQDRLASLSTHDIDRTSTKAPARPEVATEALTKTDKKQEQTIPAEVQSTPTPPEPPAFSRKQPALSTLASPFGGRVSEPWTAPISVPEPVVEPPVLVEEQKSPEVPAKVISVEKETAPDRAKNPLLKEKESSVETEPSKAHEPAADPALPTADELKVEANKPTSKPVKGKLASSQVSKRSSEPKQGKVENARPIEAVQNSDRQKELARKLKQNQSDKTVQPKTPARDITASAPEKAVAATPDQKPTQPQAEIKKIGAAETASKPTPAKRATSRFRRAPAEIKGTMVAEFPTRLVIKYRQRLSRDPFEALINESKSYGGPVEGRIPSVEGLKLVGIIESDHAGNRALLEDTHGYSYILKSGDKVKKGYVLRVEIDRVYFQIFEYGWSRTVALSIDEY